MRRNRTARFDPVAFAVYPDDGESKLARRNYVVKVALRGVKQSLPGRARHRFVEMRETRLVGADLLRRHDEIEVYGEVSSRGCQKIIVNVG